MNLELGIIICLSVILLGLIVVCILYAIKEKWYKKLYETLLKANDMAKKLGLKDAEKKAYIIQAVEDKAKEMKIPYKAVEKVIGALIYAVIEYEKSKKKEVK